MLDPRSKTIQDAVAAGALISGATTSGYERVGLYALDEVLPFVNQGYRLFGYWTVDTSDSRYELFKREQTCVVCGVTGLYFALERNMKRTVIRTEMVDGGVTTMGIPFRRQRNIYGWVPDPNGRWHFNLYGIKDGEEVMLTKDHILPKSKGGANAQNNYQTMCLPCNGKKADKVIPVSKLQEMRVGQ